MFEIINTLYEQDISGDFVAIANLINQHKRALSRSVNNKI